MRRLAGTVVALLAAAVPAGAAGGPSTLRCQGDLAGAARTPVLLLHGTGVDAEVNWSWGYEKALLDRGQPVCTIDYPKHATVDMQRTIPMTAAAIREVSRRAGGRRIATIGHSQGAAQAVLALRFFPGLARLLDDVIGLSGAYDGGSAAIGADCADGGCSPPFWQFKPGSQLLRSLATRPVPPGPSITAIGTLYDTVVTPQPAANRVPGGRSIELQDVCPGRRFVPGYDHIQMAGDAVGFALATDALDHRGPADPARVSRSNCALELFPGADPVKLATLAPQLAAAFQGDGAAADVAHEPALHCPFAAGCDVLASWRALPGRRAVVLRVRVRRAGRVRLVADGQPMRAVAVAPGRSTLHLPAPPASARSVLLEARSVPGTPWARLGPLRPRSERARPR